MDWKPEKDTDSGKIVSKYSLTQGGLRFVLCFLFVFNLSSALKRGAITLVLSLFYCQNGIYHISLIT